MRIRFLLDIAAFLLVLLSAIPGSAEEPGPLRLEKEIPLPGVEGRIDHFSADEVGQRLFVAALGNGSVEIVDLRHGERTAEIKGLEESQGLYYNSNTGRLYVATGGDGKLRVYDGKSLALLWRGNRQAQGEATAQNNRLNGVFEALTALGITRSQRSMPTTRQTMCASSF